MMPLNFMTNQVYINADASFDSSNVDSTKYQVSATFTKSTYYRFMMKYDCATQTVTSAVYTLDGSGSTSTVLAGPVTYHDTNGAKWLETKFANNVSSALPDTIFGSNFVRIQNFVGDVQMFCLNH